MKKAILSLAALCVLTAFSSEKLKSAESNVYHPFNKKQNGTPVTYKNLKGSPGFLVINDITTGQTYSTSLAPTGAQPVSTGIELTIGDRLEVTLYSGPNNGPSTLRFQDITQSGVTSLYIPQIGFLPSPSMVVIQ